MKAFILSVVVAVGLALAASAVLRGSFSETADDAFSTVSARVGEGGSIAARGWY